jgi:hypothetical protein
MEETANQGGKTRKKKSTKSHSKWLPGPPVANEQYVSNGSSATYESMKRRAGSAISTTPQPIMLADNPTHNMKNQSSKY